MSHIALQRVVVRMLYDDTFSQAVYADGARATDGSGLSEQEIRWLTKLDPRAYRVDPYRRARSLTGLLEEFPVASALVVRQRENAHALDAFFSSGIFHAGMQRGASMAALFGEWLVEGADAAAADFARLAATMAAARRARKAALAPIPAAGELALSDGIDFLDLPSGRIDSYAAQFAALQAGPGSVVENVVDLQVTLPEVEAVGDGVDCVLIDGHLSNLRLEALSPELGQVLQLCRTPIAFGRFVEKAGELGAERADCEEIVGSFAEDGVLRVGTSGPS